MIEDFLQINYYLVHREMSYPIGNVANVTLSVSNLYVRFFFKLFINNHWYMYTGNSEVNVKRHFYSNTV